MFIEDRLIISYICDPEQNHYYFLLSGGERRSVTREEFAAHWQAFQSFESERAASQPYNYRPLPVTYEIHRTVAARPIDGALRRAHRAHKMK